MNLSQRDLILHRRSVENNVDLLMKSVSNIELYNMLCRDHIEYYKMCKTKDSRSHFKSLLVKFEIYSKFFLEPTVYICDDTRISLSYKDEDNKFYSFMYKIDTDLNIYENFDRIIIGKFNRIKFYVYDNIEGENGEDEIVFCEN